MCGYNHFDLICFVWHIIVFFQRIYSMESNFLIYFIVNIRYYKFKSVFNVKSFKILNNIILYTLLNLKTKLKS